jgi:hypothetical protein
MVNEVSYPVGKEVPTMMKNSVEQSQEWLQQYRAGLCAGAEQYTRRLVQNPAPLDVQDRQNVIQLLTCFAEFMETMVDFGDDPLERMWRERRVDGRDEN